MATLRRSDDTGLTLYVILRNESHQLVIAATGAVEAYNSSNWATYVHAATEQGATGYYYVTTSGNLAAGIYWIEWKYQAGASPAVSDPIRASGMAYWDGEAWAITAADALSIKNTIGVAGAGLTGITGVKVSVGIGAGQINVSNGVVPASGNWSTYAGADTSGVTTLLQRIPQIITMAQIGGTGVYYIEALNSAGAVIGTSTYAGADTAGTTELLTRIPNATPGESGGLPVLGNADDTELRLQVDVVQQKGRRI